MLAKDIVPFPRVFDDDVPIADRPFDDSLDLAVTSDFVFEASLDLDGDPDLDGDLDTERLELLTLLGMGPFPSRRSLLR